MGRVNTHILGTQKENYDTLKDIHHCLLLINKNLEIKEHIEKLESSGKATEVCSWIGALTNILASLKHFVLNVKAVVTSNRYWQTFMLVNDTSDKESLDLLAALDRSFRPSVIDKCIMEDLDLKSLGKAIVVNQKVRVEQFHELLNFMVSSGLALKQQKPLLL